MGALSYLIAQAVCQNLQIQMRMKTGCSLPYVFVLECVGARLLSLPGHTTSRICHDSSRRQGAITQCRRGLHCCSCLLLLLLTFSWHAQARCTCAS